MKRIDETMINDTETQSRPQSADRMFDLYRKLGDFQLDYRNHNLNIMVLDYIKGDIFLDIGCGASYLVYLAKRKVSQAIGMEPDPKLVQLAKAVFGNLDLIPLEAENLDEVDIRPDTISLIDVLEHIKDDRAVLQVIHNKLKPGGRLILVVPAYQFLYGSRDKSMGHFRRYSRSELCELLKKIGFKMKRTRYWNFLGVIPYFLAEKALGIELSDKSRSPAHQHGANRAISKALHAWFKYVENRLDFRAGLSILCVCEK